MIEKIKEIIARSNIKEVIIRNKIKIAIIASVCLIILTIFGCGSKRLTVKNIEDYVELEVSLGAADSRYNIITSSYYFKTVAASVEVYSVSPSLRFKNCEIVVRVSRYFDDEKVTIDVPVKISVGGTGSNSITQSLETAVFFGLAGIDNPDAYGEGSYKIISVKGSVKG